MSQHEQNDQNSQNYQYEFLFMSTITGINIVFIVIYR